MPLQNANTKTLSQTTNADADVSGAVERNLMPAVFEKMQRQMIDGRMQAIPIKINSLASVQPLSPKLLKVKPEGERAWSWYMIHTTTNLELRINDRFLFNGRAYKNMGKENWSPYGYFYYEVISDLTDRLE